jgi:hypothetical protein
MFRQATIFVTLSDKYSDLKSLESDLNTAIQSRLPDGIREGKQKIAIDFNAHSILW